MTPNNLKKADAAGILQSAQDLMRKLSAQFDENKEIDQSTFDQLNAVLNVAADSGVSTPSEGSTGTTTESTPSSTKTSSTTTDGLTADSTRS